MIDKVTIDNLEIEYWEKGSGPVLLFIHGAFGSFRFYRPLLETLSEKYHVYAPVLPGMGKSRSNYNPSLEQYTNIIEEFIVKVCASDQVVVVGHSLGGSIAIELMARGTVSISKLFLFNPAAYPIENYMVRTTLGWGQMIIQHLKHIKTLKINEIVPWDATNMIFRRTASFLKIVSFLKNNNALRPKIPEQNYDNCTIVSSLDDAYVLPEHSRYIHRKMPGSRFVTLNGDGHNWLMYNKNKCAEIISGN